MSGKVLLFGGSYDPIHNAHLKSAQFVAETLNFQTVVFIPNSRNPLKSVLDTAPAEHRLRMVELASQAAPELFTVDPSEIERGGDSYTIETVQRYQKLYPAENLYLLLGADSFERFDEWKDFADILNITNLVVMSRSGLQLPRSIDDLPDGVRPLVAIFDPHYCELKSGRHIYFQQIPESEISSTEARRRLRIGKSVDALLPYPVIDYIRENRLYLPLEDRIGDLEEFVQQCVRTLKDKKAISPRAFDLRGTNAPSDFAILVSGTSTRHVKSLGEHLALTVKEEFGIGPIGLEGLTEGRWVLIDYGSLIVHVFYDFVRGEYRLEDLWKKGRELTLQD